MITSKLTPSGVLIVQPSGPITEEDFAALCAKVDPWIEEGNQLKGLLIDAPEFPGWQNLSGLTSHFRFVRDHHNMLPRVAFVSSSHFVSALPKIARHFVKAGIKHFDAGETEKAMAWLESPAETNPHPIRHAWFPNQKLIWVSVNGKLTSAAYRHFLDDVEAILAETTPISFLVDIDDLEGIEPGALFADMKFGFTHLKHFRRIAMVGDEKWCQRLAAMPNPFSLKIKAFDEGNEHEAWDWLTD